MDEGSKVISPEIRIKWAVLAHIIDFAKPR